LSYASELTAGRHNSQRELVPSSPEVWREFEKAARKGSGSTLAFRLPLPERTGSDRDEPHCPHGFVDRAYSFFL